LRLLCLDRKAKRKEHGGKRKAKNVFFMTSSACFAALCSVSPITSLDDFGTLFVQELVTAIGTKEFDLLVTKFLRVAIELSLALRAGHPENFCHDFSLEIPAKDAEPNSRNQTDPVPFYILASLGKFLRIFRLDLSPCSRACKLPPPP
jgi:hypothetical protein